MTTEQSKKAEYIKKDDVLDLVHSIYERTYWLDNNRKLVDGICFRAFLERFIKEVNLMKVKHIKSGKK